MIRAFYGIDANPFSIDGDICLLDHQQQVFDVLQVHCHQGGLCLLMGEPGCGKSIIKKAIEQHADKSTLVVNVARTLHTYYNTLKILCQAFNIEPDGSCFKCEKRLIEQAFSLNNQGKTLIVIIDDAHLMEMTTLRKLRLLFEDFPKNHNIILIGQTQLLYSMTLRVNEDIKNRVTYSTILKKLTPEAIEAFIIAQFDAVGLAHNIITEDAMALIARSCEGILRTARNLVLACMVEAIRSREKIIGIANVNRVLIQPHWRIERDAEQFL
jgi:type II secretory pathway predicted ATPase ExeA